jgi:hypothetical protein
LRLLRQPLFPGNFLVARQHFATDKGFTEGVDQPHPAAFGDAT